MRNVRVETMFQPLGLPGREVVKMRTVWFSPGWFADGMWRRPKRGQGFSVEDLQWMYEQRRKWVQQKKKQQERDRKWLERFRARRAAAGSRGR
jgi:hypothetical protein